MPEQGVGKGEVWKEDGGSGETALPVGLGKAGLLGEYLVPSGVALPAAGGVLSMAADPLVVARLLCGDGGEELLLGENLGSREDSLLSLTVLFPFSPLPPPVLFTALLRYNLRTIKPTNAQSMIFNQFTESATVTTTQF